MVPVLHVPGEQLRDLFSVIALPGLDVSPQPAVDIGSVHGDGRVVREFMGCCRVR
jgi:hypothetical protein